MPEQLPPQEVKEKIGTRGLLTLVNEIGAKHYEGYVGRRAEILVEGPSKRNPARMMGRTRSNKIVVFDLPRAASWAGDGGEHHSGRGRLRCMGIRQC